MNLNILANLIGSLWTLVMGVAFVPLYLRHINTEGYGLIGFFASLTAVLSLLDVGLTMAVQREVAKAPALDREAQKQLQDLVFSMEVLFWSVGGVLGVILVGLAPWLSTHWIKTGSLDPGVAAHALQFLGASFIFQLPLSFYNGCLTGAQQHVKLSYIALGMSTFRSVGAALVLEFVSPTIEAFFAWQFLVSFLWTAVTRLVLWVTSPKAIGRPTFSKATLRRVAGFAAGVGGGNLLGILLLQVDKLVASQQLSLSDFGRYTLAWTLASSLYRQTFPVFNAVYPRLVQLLAGGHRKEMLRVYYRGCLVMSALLVPSSLMLACYGHEVVLLWLNNKDMAGQLAPILACQALGVMCNGLCHIPYALQLANGSTRITLQTSLISLLLMVPATFYGAHYYGSWGTAMAWMIIYALLVPAQLLTHRAFLPGHFSGWLLYCVIIPITVSGLLYLPGHWFWPAAALTRRDLALALSALMAANLCGLGLFLYQMYRRRIGLKVVEVPGLALDGQPLGLPGRDTASQVGGEDSVLP